MAACRAASACGLRSVAPAMVEPPIAILQRRERAHQNIVGLARHDRAHAEELHRLRRCLARAAPDRCRARRRWSCPRTPKSERSVRAVAALVTTIRLASASAAFSSANSCCRRDLERAGLQAQRMVHQRDDRRAHALDEVGRQGAIGKAIDDERGPSRHAGKHPLGFGEVGWRWARETSPAARGAAPPRRIAAAAPARADRTCSRRSADRCRREWRRRRGSCVIPGLVIPVLAPGSSSRRSKRH